MTDLMERQLEAIIYMVFAGMTVMMLVHTSQVILQRAKKSKALYRIIYLFYWVAAVYIFCQYLYEATYGVIFWFTLPAFVAGCILWKKTFCGIITLYENAKKYDGDKENEEKNKRES